MSLTRGLHSYDSWESRKKICEPAFSPKITRMARFGDNLKALRDALGLNQKELAPRLRTEAGEEMQQSGLSKLELLEFAPKPKTVTRLAEGLAPLLRLSEKEVRARLLNGVSSRFDAVQAQRADPPDQWDELRDLTSHLPPDKQAHFDEEFKRLRAEIAKAAKRAPKGA